MGYENILVEIGGDFVAELTLNRPNNLKREPARPFVPASMSVIFSIRASASIGTG